MNKVEAKQKIAVAIKKFESYREQNLKLKETATRTDLIEPLFEALGWAVGYSLEVSKEEQVSKGRVDYGFRINGIPKFFLEAKELNEDLDGYRTIDGIKITFAEQAISYAWLKQCTWAVLTNFRELRLYNAEIKEANNMWFSLDCEKDFLADKFERLFLLSRESFENNLIDKVAESWGKKSRKLPIDKQLLADFMRFRVLLSKNISKLNQNKNITQEDLDESIQRILDRLIFIRNCEDRELEAKELLSGMRERAGRGKGHLVKSLQKIFDYFRNNYNSKIFATHLCDDLDIDNDVLQEIIEGLYYTQDQSAYYDFSAIESDVLGNIYEQYLGHILKKSLKGAKVKDSPIHRKKQGIYYTPTYIVKYIVNNTLGELLKDKNIDVEKIRVLDPACGSGSFLIKAFDVLHEHYANHDKNYSQPELDFRTGGAFTTKVKILKEHLYGVDLDKQAIEIAQLNLFLKIVEKRKILPYLEDNLKCGNSLIGNPLIAGDKALAWRDSFKDRIQEGGFDIIIGNPPYIRSRNLTAKDRQFFSGQYVSAFRTFDIYLFFIEKALELLKPGGFFGFIIPYSFMNQPYATKSRELLLKQGGIVEIVDLSEYRVFKDAQVKNCIIICRKGARNKVAFQSSIVNNVIQRTNKIDTDQFRQNSDCMYKLEITPESKPILKRIASNSIPLGSICYISKGIEVYERNSGRTKDDFISKDKKAMNYQPYLEAKEIVRYGINWRDRYINYQPKKHCSGKFPELFENDKIIMKRIIGQRGIVATLDGSKFYVENTLICVLLKNQLSRKIDFDSEDLELSQQYNLKIILGILNSRMITYYFTNKLSDKLQIYNRAVEELPIIKITKSQSKSQGKVCGLVDTMLALSGRLRELEIKKTDELTKIKDRLQTTDEEIDALVYDLYGLAPEEREIIKDSLNEKK